MFFVCVYRHNCILYCWTWVLILHKTTVYFQSVFSQLTMNFSLAINGYARWFGEKQKKGSRKRKGLKSTEVNGNMSNDVQITTKNSNAQIPSTRTRTIHNRYYVQVFFFSSDFHLFWWMWHSARYSQVRLVFDGTFEWWHYALVDIVTIFITC